MSKTKAVKIPMELYEEAKTVAAELGVSIGEALPVMVSRRDRGEPEETMSQTTSNESDDIRSYGVLPEVSPGNTLVHARSEPQVIEVMEPGTYITREEFEPVRRMVAVTARSHARHLYGHVQRERGVQQLPTDTEELAEFIAQLEAAEADENFIEDMYQLLDTLAETAALPEHTHE